VQPLSISCVLMDSLAKAYWLPVHHSSCQPITEFKDKQPTSLRMAVLFHTLTRHKQHQQELEDVALDLRSELDTTKQQLEAAWQAAQQSDQKCIAAEAKLMAAGLGNGQMPKMGPTAEQLIVNSTQRIK